MPGGKPSVTSNPPSLEGFLSRRKRSVKHWLVARGVVTVDSLDQLIKSGDWEIPPEFAAYMKTLVRTNTTPPPPPPPTQELVLVEQPEEIEIGSVVKPKRKEKDKREK